MSVHRFARSLFACFLLACTGEPTASEGRLTLTIPGPVARAVDAQTQGIPVILRNGTRQELLFVTCDKTPRLVLERFANGIWEAATAEECPANAQLSLAPLAVGAFYARSVVVAEPGRYRFRVQGGTVLNDLLLAQGMVIRSAPFVVQ